MTAAGDGRARICRACRGRGERMVSVPGVNLTTTRTDGRPTLALARCTDCDGRGYVEVVKCGKCGQMVDKGTMYARIGLGH